MPENVIINWGVSSFFGWGVYGLNLALAWASDPDLTAACARPIQERGLVLDPLRRTALGPFGRRSMALLKQIQAAPAGEAEFGAVMLDSLHHSFDPVKLRPDLALKGRRNVGVTFFQDTRLEPEALARAAAYDVVVAGSTWNARLMEAQGLTNVRTILQGIDPTLFHVAPRQGVLADRFLVFSGGKLERRKGQDIVMAAFARFAERHADALLVTAWRSPWPETALTLEAGSAAPPPVMDAQGQVDVRAWAKACGIAPGQVLDLGAVANALMPPILREMDVALFPNRGEGGTNLVAMEAMACGVPSILSRNTGHLDLIEDGNCYVLETQGALAGDEGPAAGVEGWGESDVDEAVACLEAAYADREGARRRGEAGAQTLSRLTWAETARQMKALVRELA